MVFWKQRLLLLEASCTSRWWQGMISKPKSLLERVSGMVSKVMLCWLFGGQTTSTLNAGLLFSKAWRVKLVAVSDIGNLRL